MMSDYAITWITPKIGAGRAPMSFDELQSIKEQGVSSIINLCGEFSDLHELEEKAGFEVMWIPIADETAPTLADMEKGLEWLDEAVYLEKTVLIHCRHGIGRTGTFITAYLLRRGFGLKRAGKLLKATLANPTNFSQWRLLRKIGKKEGRLLHIQPTPENRNYLDLNEFYRRYELIIEKAERLSSKSAIPFAKSCCSENDSNRSRRESFYVKLIEAVYLHHKVNTILTTKQRQSVLEKTERIRTDDIENDICPLLNTGICMLSQYRPLHCRLRASRMNQDEIDGINEELSKLSQEVFLHIFGHYNDRNPPAVELLDAITGRFIQNYFSFLVSNEKKDKQ